MLTRWLRTSATYDFGWVWTPWTYRLGHGGWIFLHPGKPLVTLRWLWRCRHAVPRAPAPPGLSPGQAAGEGR